MGFKIDDLAIRKTGLSNTVWKDVVGSDNVYEPKRVTKVISDAIELEGLNGFWAERYFELYVPPQTTITLVEEYKQTLIQIEQLQSKAKTLLEEINKASK